MQLNCFGGLAALIFEPIACYFFRLLNHDNGCWAVVCFFTTLFLILLTLKKKQIKLIVDDKSIIYIFIMFLFFVPLWVVSEGFLRGSIIYNQVFDMRKIHGMLLACISSDGLEIQHSWMQGYKCCYYQFYFFRLAEVFKILGTSSPIYSFSIVLFLDSLMLCAAMLFVVRKAVGVNDINRIFVIAFLLALDGGMHGIVSWINGNALYPLPSAWVRDYSFSPIVHDNLLIKLVWQPQHVAAAIVGGYAVINLIFLCQIEGSKNLIRHMVTAMALVSVFGTSVLMALGVFISVMALLIYQILKEG